MKSSVYYLALTVFALVLQYLGSVLGARVLGPVEFGYYTFVYSVVVSISLFSVAGLDRLAAVQFPYLTRDHDWVALRGFAYFATCFVLFSSLLFSFSFFSFPFNFSYQVALLASLLLVVHSLSLLWSSFLHAAGKPATAKFAESVPRAVLITIFLFWTMRQENSFSSGEMIGLAAVSSLPGLAILLAVLTFMMSDRLSAFRFSVQPKLWLAQSFPLALASVFSVLKDNVDVFILMQLGSASDVGIFRVASRGAFLVLFLAAAIVQSKRHVVSSSVLIDDRASLRTVLGKLRLMMFAFPVSVGLCFIIFPQFYFYLFGSDYISGVPLLKILAFARIIDVSVIFSGALLLALGCQKTLFYLSVLAFCLHGLFSFIFTLFYGSLGAALASVFSSTFLAIFSAWLLWKMWGLNGTLFFWR